MVETAPLISEGAWSLSWFSSPSAFSSNLRIESGDDVARPVAALLRSVAALRTLSQKEPPPRLAPEPLDPELDDEAVDGVVPTLPTLPLEPFEELPQAA